MLRGCMLGKKRKRGSGTKGFTVTHTEWTAHHTDTRANLADLQYCAEAYVLKPEAYAVLCRSKYCKAFNVQCAGNTFQ